ncbi:MAG: hypothetical protein ACD_58C00317G0011 [uncultured bacterium]|nr:MAG: hypothetical protein ACD_58C00317G0011 [uncultured bacterium]
MLKSLVKTVLYIPLYNALIFLVWLVPGHSVGWAIIILTIIIRLLLYPSSAKTVVIQKKMQQLQPELEKIKEKYKDDKQGQAQATMQFYQTNKINPLSGCLPLLVQLPILYVLYYVFRVGLDESRFSLLYSFIPRPEYVNAIFLGMDLNQPSIYLAVLAGILQFFQSRQMMAKQVKKPNTNNKNDDSATNFQNIFSTQMVYLFPIITVMIGTKLPAALAIYWSITTAFMILQQWWIYNKAIDNVTVKIRKA